MNAKQSGRRFNSILKRQFFSAASMSVLLLNDCFSFYVFVFVFFVFLMLRHF